MTELPLSGLIVAATELGASTVFVVMLHVVCRLIIRLNRSVVMGPSVGLVSS